MSAHEERMKEARTLLDRLHRRIETSDRLRAEYHEIDRRRKDRMRTLVLFAYGLEDAADQPRV